MSLHDFKLTLGEANVSALKTEDDVQREARRLLPGALEQVGRAVGETAWKELQKAFRGPGLKVNKSAGDKRKFVDEAARNYVRQASAKDRRELEALIVRQLRELMTH